MKGLRLLVYPILEHQSTAPPAMALRLSTYSIELLHRLVREKKADYRNLPPVIALVVHQGPEPWDSPLSVEETCPLPLGLEWLRPFQPAFRYLVLDLGTEKGRAVAKHPFVKLVLDLMAAAARGRVLEWLMELRNFEKALPAKDGDVMMTILLIYAINRDERITEQVLEETAKQNPETGKTIMTLFEKREALGEARGKALGEARGELQGIIKVLTTYFRWRFHRDLRQSLKLLPGKPLLRLSKEYMKFETVEALDEWLKRHLPKEAPKKPKRAKKVAIPPVS